MFKNPLTCHNDAAQKVEEKHNLYSKNNKVQANTASLALNY